MRQGKMVNFAGSCCWGTSHLGHIDAREDGGGLTDARQPLRQQLRRQVVEVQVDVVLLGAWGVIVQVLVSSY